MTISRNSPRTALLTLAVGCALAAPSIRGQASFQVFGTACQGSTGVPALTGGAPIAGGRFEVRIERLRPASPGFLVLAQRNDILGAATLPIDLAVIGAPGCSLSVNSDPGEGAASLALQADSVGRATLTLGVPSHPAVLGAVVYCQYFSLDAPRGRPLMLTTTQAGRGVVGVPGVPGMVPIPAGVFAMGSVRGRPQEQPVHAVQITRPYWIGAFEVTQADYQSVTGANPSRFVGPNRPVESVTWQQAVAYCDALTTREEAAGRLPIGYEYRLPTEAEWEYACRASTTAEWNTVSSPTCSQVNFLDVAAARVCVGQSVDVGRYPPNGFGLHDMHGNVLEWCLDSWDGNPSYPAGPVSDPLTTSGPYRVLRGGAWNSSADFCRSAARAWFPPNYGRDVYGFRVALAPRREP